MSWSLLCWLIVQADRLVSKSKLGIVSQRHAKGWPGLETFVLLRQLHLSMGVGGLSANRSASRC